MGHACHVLFGLHARALHSKRQFGFAFVLLLERGPDFLPPLKTRKKPAGHMYEQVPQARRLTCCPCSRDWYQAGVQRQQGSDAGLHPQLRPQGASNPAGEMSPLPIPSESRGDVPSLPGGSHVSHRNRRNPSTSLWKQQSPGPIQPHSQSCPTETARCRPPRD